MSASTPHQQQGEPEKDLSSKVVHIPGVNLLAGGEIGCQGQCWRWGTPQEASPKVQKQQKGAGIGEQRWGTWRRSTLRGEDKMRHVGDSGERSGKQLHSALRSRKKM